MNRLLSPCTANLFKRKLGTSKEQKKDDFLTMMKKNFQEAFEPKLSEFSQDKN